ncbi:MAG: dioxygenase [Pseudomonadota bacterium]
MKKSSVCIILFMAFMHNAYATERVYKNRLNTCTPTKEVINNYEPIVFQPSNNLLHKAGLAPIFCGEKMLLKGKVLDKNCVPVSDAKIYAWQAGCDGKYPYKPLRKSVNQSHINLESASSFQGSGTATSNNNGEFQFITIRPTSSSKINIRVEHMLLGTIQTAFAPTDNGCGCEASDVYDVTIVMDKVDLHRRY